METRSKFYFAIIIILTITIIIFFILNSKIPNTQSSNIESLEECKIIQNNGKNKIDIVFFGSELLSKEWSNYFLQSEPFNQYKDSFNFYYIDDYKVECELYQGIAILCHSRDLLKKAASCPNDYIIVLKEDERRIRSSAYKNVMSINTVHPKTVLLHEFGHSFANLAEEYTPANIPRGSKNCVSECTQFPDKNGKIDGCFQQCSKSNYYRSIAEGVMRTLNTPNFGIFNNNLIKELIEKAVNTRPVLTGQAIDTELSCQEQQYTLVDVDTINNKATTTEIFNGCAPTQSGAGTYSYDLDGLMYQFSTDFIYDYQPENSDTLEGGSFTNTDFSVAVPFYNNQQSIDFYDSDGDLFASTDFSHTGTTPCQL